MICWGTYTHYYNWIVKFLTESDIFDVRRRGNSFVLIDSRKNSTEYLDAASFNEQFPVLKRWIRGECVVFSTMYEAKEAASDYYCNAGVKIFVHPDAATFYEMFITTKHASDILDEDVLTVVPQTIDIPIYISETIKDLGLYDVCDTVEKNIRRTIGESTDLVYADSQLKTLVRVKKTFDDDGNLLPFYHNDDSENNELLYKIGDICDVTYSDGSYYCNVLREVKYYTLDGTEIPALRNQTSYSSSMPDEGIISFVYEVGDIINETGSTINGIKYTERRHYTIEIHEEFGKYVSIEGTSIDVPETPLPGASYAIVENNIEAIETIETGGHMVKNDAFLDIQDSKIDYDDVYVERGTSAAYEAFNVLGETNTIEDIENYRDDWFRIKGKND